MHEAGIQEVWEFSYPCPLNWLRRGYFCWLEGLSDFQSAQQIFDVTHFLIFSAQIKVCQQTPGLNILALFKLRHLYSFNLHQERQSLTVTGIIIKGEFFCLFFGGWIQKNRSVIKNLVNYLYEYSNCTHPLGYLLWGKGIPSTLFEMFLHLSGNENRNDGTDVF